MFVVVLNAPLKSHYITLNITVNLTAYLRGVFLVNFKEGGVARVPLLSFSGESRLR